MYFNNEMGFQHPGTVMSPKMTLTLRVDSASNDVRKNALHVMIRNTPINYQPTVIEVVDIPYGGGYGHKEFTNDAAIAYQSALLLWGTCNIAYADVAIRIIKNWSEHDKVFRGDNAPLEAAWGACSLARAAELIKYHTDPKVQNQWLQVESVFVKWLNNIIIPVLQTRSIWKWNVIGNWHFSIICARMQIAIFKEDKTEFDWAVKTYRDNLNKAICIGHPCHIAETKRDVTHASFLLGGLLQVPEMAYHQGVKDLYDKRLHPILEYHARIMLGEVPEGLKKEEIHTPYGLWNEPVWEIGLSHFHGRLGLPMPKTEQNLIKLRPERVTFHWGGGTLTHYKRTVS